MRIAVFVDQIFWRDGERISTNESYALFLTSLAADGNELVLIGREAPKPGRAPYELTQSGVSLCPIPFYPSLHRLWRSDPRIYRRIRKQIRRQASGRWDVLLFCGPHPIGQLIARDCLRLGIPVGLVVRQNLPAQIRALDGLKGVVAASAVRLFDWSFKRLARQRTALTVGAELTEMYRRLGARAHNHFPCLVDDRLFAELATAACRSDPRRLLCVGRLEPEKGIEYLLRALVSLRDRGLTCSLDIVGTGTLDQDLKTLAGVLGLATQVTFHGYVPYGPALMDVYQQAGVLVLPSLTEGFPQVVNESLSVGLPTIATAVGGIPAFLEDGVTALLVAARDPDALAGAIDRMVTDGSLRERLRNNGRMLMRENTLEANRTRMMEVIRTEMLSAA